MLGLDDPAAGVTAHEAMFANARHTQAVRALRCGTRRLAGIRVRLFGDGPEAA
jgi:hypothetical protein